MTKDLAPLLPDQKWLTEVSTRSTRTCERWRSETIVLNRSASTELRGLSIRSEHGRSVERVLAHYLRQVARS
jgi:hypothetical protein